MLGINIYLISSLSNNPRYINWQEILRVMNIQDGLISNCFYRKGQIKFDFAQLSIFDFDIDLKIAKKNAK